MTPDMSTHAQSHVHRHNEMRQQRTEGEGVGQRKSEESAERVVREI